MYLSIYLSLSLSIYIYIYTFIDLHICTRRWWASWTSWAGCTPCCATTCAGPDTKTRGKICFDDNINA